HNLLPDGSGFVYGGLAVKTPMKPGSQVRVQDRYFRVLLDVLQETAAGPLPIGQMLVIEDHHAALIPQAGLSRSRGGCQNTWGTIGQSIIDPFAHLLCKANHCITSSLLS